MVRNRREAPGTPPRHAAARGMGTGLRFRTSSAGPSGRAGHRRVRRAGTLTGWDQESSGFSTALRQQITLWRSAALTVEPLARQGRVTQAVGLVIETSGPAVALGELVAIESPAAGTRSADPAGEPWSAEGAPLARVPARILAEAVGFRAGRLLVMPLQATDRLAPGAVVTALGRRLSVGCGDALLGRVLDGLGQPLDGRGPVRRAEWRNAEADPPPALDRRPIREPLPVGVRAIDGLLTCGRGQRLGIFAGSGVGKSTLLGMLCRHTTAQVVIVALVGERGREVREFVEGDLGSAALARAVVVVATSDQPAVVRMKAPLVATTLAEYFRDQGADVLLVMDSLTRFALAGREVGLASGEPPTTRGYTPSVFAALPRLLERSGTSARGSITGFYTVLVEGDDMNEPVADAVRGLLDGHVVLSRELAAGGQYPAIDVLQSVSRLQPRLVDHPHASAAQRVRQILATMREAQDLVDVGAYRSGNSAAIDHALRWIGPVRNFLRQGRDDLCPWPLMRDALLALGAEAPGGSPQTVSGAAAGRAG